MFVSILRGQIAVNLVSVATTAVIKLTLTSMLPKMSAWDYILSSTQNGTQEQASVNAPYVSGSHFA
jgi:hypothetical protein